MVVVARIGATTVVFGLVTLLDHPPETTCFIYFIYNIVLSGPLCSNPLGGLGGVVEGGPETKNNQCSPDPRDMHTRAAISITVVIINYHDKSLYTFYPLLDDFDITRGSGA